MYCLTFRSLTQEHDYSGRVGLRLTKQERARDPEPHGWRALLRCSPAARIDARCQTASALGKVLVARFYDKRLSASRIFRKGFLMTHASGFLDYDRLPLLIEEGYITRREHPEYPLFILNYSAKCQYDKAWDRTTRACRGLILDADGNVVARCIEKFFNLSEIGTAYAPMVPIGEPFEAYEKLDGSMIISYADPVCGGVR